jgi:hypothetical protein
LRTVPTYPGIAYTKKEKMILRPEIRKIGILRRQTFSFSAHKMPVFKKKNLSITAEKW